MFEEEYNKLSRGDRNLFSQVVCDLLYEVYIVRRNYDKKAKMFKVNPDYLFIERHYSLFEEYLAFIDITLSKSDEDGIIFIISGAEYNHLRMDSVTTLLVYAIRSYYEGQIEKNPQDTAVHMTSGQINNYITEMGLSNVTKRLSATTIASALRNLDSFNIVTRVSGSYSDPTYSFYILPTIRYVISNEKMNALYNFLTGNTSQEERDEMDLFSANQESNASEDGKENA